MSRLTQPLWQVPGLRQCEQGMRATGSQPPARLVVRDRGQHDADAQQRHGRQLVARGALGVARGLNDDDGGRDRDLGQLVEADRVELQAQVPQDHVADKGRRQREDLRPVSPQRSTPGAAHAPRAGQRLWRSACSSVEQCSGRGQKPQELKGAGCRAGRAPAAPAAASPRTCPPQRTPTYQTW